MVAAKGAKRPYSQLRSVLLPFQRVSCTSAGLPADEQAARCSTLRSAEWAGGAAAARRAALFAGFYLNELLMKLLARQDPHPALFDAYADTLAALASAGRAAQAALRAFELLLLREIGVLPDLAVVTLTAAAAGSLQRATRCTPRPASSRAPTAGLGAACWSACRPRSSHGSVAALQQALRRTLPALRAAAALAASLSSRALQLAHPAGHAGPAGLAETAPR